MSYHEFKAFGGTVRQLRLTRKLSQEALAELSGLHRTYICDVEHGVRNISIGTLLKIAQALGTTVSELTQNLEKDARRAEISQHPTINEYNKIFDRDCRPVSDSPLD
jgi:transcriptional regulator with XRE-family HTH domain